MYVSKFDLSHLPLLCFILVQRHLDCLEISFGNLPFRLLYFHHEEVISIDDFKTNLLGLILKYKAKQMSVNAYETATLRLK